MLTTDSASPSPTVLEWSRGLASLSPGQPPCPGFRPDEWVETLANCRRFVDDFGPEADHELGHEAVSRFFELGLVSQRYTHQQALELVRA
ncbi:hypothetical protein Mnod_7051 [Methylobacterium nodulans ORS 2060]|uniref:Uncharacterized protein n=1 Tax=Methylobacterium nodulans (strain LMG 21967 / CNCM I-2342 / ORS 2060) TaxID=460265 RepID=B8IIZ6_METNO|nr:hypothetical protein Mnod_7051 [Methylobacterium nodulans ORS 2060]